MTFVSLKKWENATINDIVFSFSFIQPHHVKKK